MKYTILLAKWEAKRILTNWHQTMTLFLVPAIVLLGAIYLFPLLVEYLSTGHMGTPPIIVVNSGDTYEAFSGSDNYAKAYEYIYWTSDEYIDNTENGTVTKYMDAGSFFVLLSPNAELDHSYSTDATDFDESVASYFTSRLNQTTFEENLPAISIYYQPNNLIAYSLAKQYEKTVLPRYSDYLLSALGGEIYEKGGGTPFQIDAFNPYTKLMEFSSVANPAGARVIPGILILLLYYCIFSLSTEVLATERESGFLAKLTLTPISARSILVGKSLAVTLVALASAATTFLVLLLASWTNRSNNALSLLPFGLLISPIHILLIFIIMLFAACLLSIICAFIIMDIKKMQDVVMNLQVPLLLFLFDFFLQLFRPSGNAYSIEYIIPVHNCTLLIHDVIGNTMHPYLFLVSLSIDLGLAYLLLHKTQKSFTPIGC